jgi:hypothetical protein
VTFNPWKPPSGWDTVEAKASVIATLSVRGVLSSVLAAVRRRPLDVLLAVCLLPALWEVPATIAYDVLVPGDEPVFGPGRSFRSIALSWARSAWSCVLAAGQLGAALAVMRDQPLQWLRFLTGLKQAPLIFAAYFAVTLPFDASVFLPMSLSGASAGVLEALGFVLMAFLFARTALWVPVIVDARRPLWESLALSVAATRGHVSKIVALGVILTACMVPLMVVDGVLFGEQLHLFGAVSGALYNLTAARLYLLLGEEWNGDANGGRQQNP